MTVFLTCDLDRTLIYSRAAAGPEFDSVTPVCVEMFQERPLSYMAADAHRAMAALSEQVHLVPTTTRTPEQYLRVRLPGGPHRYAICSNGGVILESGAPDLAWSNHIRTQVSSLPCSLADITNKLQRRLRDEWSPRIRVVPELFVYVVSETRIPSEVVDQWREYCADRGWMVSQQGRKLYTIPVPITKSAAAHEVRRRLRGCELPDDAPWLAAGDGALDADLLINATAAIRPRHGELHENHFTAPRLTVTRDSGIRAGSEIIGWLSRAAHQHTSIGFTSTVKGS